MTPLFTGRTGKAVLSSIAAISLGAGLSLAVVPAAQATPTAPPGPTAPTCWTTSLDSGSTGGCDVPTPPEEPVCETVVDDVFATEPSGYDAENWEYVSEGGGFTTPFVTSGGATATLTTTSFTVPSTSNASVSATFTHAYNIDGTGLVSYALNDAPLFTPLKRSDFTQNGPTGNNGFDDVFNEATDGPVASIATIPGASAGDTVRLRFYYGTDRGANHGWYIDSLKLTACAGDELPLVQDFIAYPDGDFAVGETVSVVLGGALQPAAAEGDVTYTWFTEDSEVPFATGQEIVLPASVKGEKVFARASYAPEGYQPATAETPPTTVVEFAKVSGAAVSIDDTTPVVGQTLSALPVTADDLTEDESLTQSFQWLSKAPNAATSTPIEGATSADYTVRPADLGATLKLRYTVKTNGRSATTVLSAATSAVEQGTISIDEAPSFTGTVRVDETLTAVAPSTTPSTDVAYQWQADTGVGGTFVDIEDATDETLTIPAALAGKLIRLAALVSPQSDTKGFASSSESGYASTTTYSDPSDPVAKGIITGTSAFIVGTARVGQTVTAGASTATQGTTPAYDWQVRTGGAWKSAATTSSFVVPASAAGQRIRLGVTFTAPGYEDSTVIADDESVVAAGSFVGSPTVAVSGTTITGRTVTAQLTGASSPAADSYTYQWLADGAAVAGADGTTLTLTPDLVGRVISVRATPIKAGYAPGAAGTSPGVGPVRAPAPVAGVSDRTIKRGQTFVVTGTDLPVGQRYTIQLSGDTVKTGVVPPSGLVSRKVRFPKATTGRTRTIRLRVFDARGAVISSLTTKVAYRR